MTASPAPGRRIPVRVLVAAVLLGLDAVSRLLELPRAVAGVAGPGGAITAPVVAIALWLAMPAALAVLAAVLLVTRRFAGVVPLILLLLYVLAVTVSSLARGDIEPVLLAELVGLVVALVLVLTPPARTWLRSSVAPPAPR